MLHLSPNNTCYSTIWPNMDSAKPTLLQNHFERITSALALPEALVPTPALEQMGHHDICDAFLHGLVDYIKDELVFYSTLPHWMDSSNSPPGWISA